MHPVEGREACSMRRFSLLRSWGPKGKVSVGWWGRQPTRRPAEEATSNEVKSTT